MPEQTPQKGQPANVQDELATRREEARVAMEGPERAAKRERTEQLKQINVDEEKYKDRLAKIRSEKEQLELAWTELDNNRKAVRKILNPLLDEEKKIEAEEASIEAEEASIGLPKDKRAVEEKRWQIQGRRKELEEKKWAEEEKIAKVEDVISQNTTRYRQLLDEEDQLQAQLDELKAEEMTL